MDANAQKMDFRKKENDDDDDDDEKTEEEGEETEEEKEEEESDKKKHVPPPKVATVDDEMPIDFEGVPPVTDSSNVYKATTEDELPMDVESIPPPPVAAVEDEMPIGFESVPPPPPPPPQATKTKLSFDTDLSRLNFDFIGSKPPAPKKAKTLVPAPIKMTVSSVVATAGQYDGVFIKLAAQMSHDTTPPAWKDHSLVWKHECNAHTSKYSLSALKASEGSTEAEVNLNLLGLPNVKGCVDIYLDNEGGKEHVRVTIVPGNLDQKATTFKVLQPPEGIRAGEPITVVVIPRDQYSNEGAPVKGEDIVVVAQGKEQVKGVCSTVKPLAATKLEYAMTLKTSGKYKLFVSCARTMISGAPMEVTVSAGRLAKIELKDLPSGSQVECGGTLPNFRIAGQDAFGNAVKCSASDISMELYAKGDASKRGRIENQKVEANAITGNLIVRNTAVSPCPGTYGEYVLKVVSSGVEKLVTVCISAPELDVAKCRVERPVSTQLGALCKFMVKLINTLGGPHDRLVEEGSIELECRAKKYACEGLVTQTKGSAEIVFFPTRVGRCEVFVRIAGKNVTGSPFALDVVKPYELKPIIPVKHDDDDDDDDDSNYKKKDYASTFAAPPSVSSPIKTSTSLDSADCDLQTLPF